MNNLISLNVKPGRIAAFFIVWGLTVLICLLLLLNQVSREYDRQRKQFAKPISPILPYLRPF